MLSSICSEIHAWEVIAVSDSKSSLIENGFIQGNDSGAIIDKIFDMSKYRKQKSEIPGKLVSRLAALYTISDLVDQHNKLSTKHAKLKSEYDKNEQAINDIKDKTEKKKLREANKRIHQKLKSVEDTPKSNILKIYADNLLELQVSKDRHGRTEMMEAEVANIRKESDDME